ncbi:hypothetical protein Pyn_00710 [Prunus yedoensis var. nudiflora]|uniref:Thionin-like protein 2 n=1 Tax=Prunus yedoensis var. nudiflora TaxID=2094558 RepID=A0A314XW26_PRUYE|nr:hypothetical protein Pyn_00710 [Prunus yedoensis var. nudiflora]
MNDDRISDFPVSAPAPSPDQAPMSPINKKVYACGERCENRCMKESSEYPVYSKCTTTCMEPYIRTLVDGVYSCTFGCTKSLSTQFATGMAQVESYFGACYNSCKNH